MGPHEVQQRWIGRLRTTRADKLAPLLTSTSVRLSIHFLHGETPSAELAVWACIVPAGTMQHPVLLGRDSWMLYAQRTCTILPPQPSQPIFGELSLSVPRTEGLSTFISDNRPTQYHFRLCRLSSRSTWFAPRVSLPSPATTYSTRSPATAFHLKPKSSSPMGTKQSHSQDSLTSN